MRDEVRWKRALERIRDLKPEVVIPSVGPAISGEEAVARVLDSGIEYLDFLHRAVAREMNRGSSLEETLENTRLPKRLAENPGLVEAYGCHRFNVEGLYHRYSGWFDQNGTHLDRAPVGELAGEMIADMGGARAVMSKARELQEEGRHRLALEYLDLLLDEDGEDRDAHRLKGQVLLELAKENRGHAMTRNMYLKLSERELSSAEGSAAGGGSISRPSRLAGP